MGGVGFKSRDLGNDRGYRVVAALAWAMGNLNPHPKAGGIVEVCCSRVVQARFSGAAEEWG
jgi:hypothetical protein